MQLLVNNSTHLQAFTHWKVSYGTRLKSRSSRKEPSEILQRLLPSWHQLC